MGETAPTSAAKPIKAQKLPAPKTQKGVAGEDQNPGLDVNDAYVPSGELAPQPTKAKSEPQGEIVPLPDATVEDAENEGQEVTAPNQSDLTEEEAALYRLDDMAHRFGGCVFMDGEVTPKFMKVWASAKEDGFITRKEMELLIEALDPETNIFKDLNITLRGENWLKMTGGQDKVSLDPNSEEINFFDVVGNLYSEHTNYGMNLLSLAESKHLILVDNKNVAKHAKENYTQDYIKSVYAKDEGLGNRNALTRILEYSGVTRLAGILGVELEQAQGPDGKPMSYYTEESVLAFFKALADKEAEYPELIEDAWAKIGRQHINEVKSTAQNLDIEISFDLNDPLVMAAFERHIGQPYFVDWKTPDEDAFAKVEEYQQKILELNGWMKGLEDGENLTLEGIEDAEYDAEFEKKAKEAGVTLEDIENGDSVLMYLAENCEDLGADKVGDILSLLISGPTLPQGGAQIEVAEAESDEASATEGS